MCDVMSEGKWVVYISYTHTHPHECNTTHEIKCYKKIYKSFVPHSHVHMNNFRTKRHLLS